MGSLTLFVCLCLCVLHTDGLEGHDHEDISYRSKSPLSLIQCIADHSQCPSVVVSLHGCQCGISGTEIKTLLGHSLKVFTKMLYVKTEEAGSTFLTQYRFTMNTSTESVNSVQVVSINRYTLQSTTDINSEAVKTSKTPATAKRIVTLQTKTKTNVSQESTVSNHQLSTDKRTPLSTVRKVWKDECHGPQCCQCGSVVEYIMNQEHQRSAVYVMIEDRRWIRFYILSRRKKTFVQLPLKFNTREHYVNAFHIATSMCMGMFQKGNSVISACLNGNNKRTLFTKRGNNRILTSLYDIHLRLIIYLVEDEGHGKARWNSFSISEREEQFLITVNVKLTTPCFLDETHHLLYWFHEHNLYQYDYMKHGEKPEQFNRRRLPDITDVRLSPQKDKLVLCTNSNGLLIKNLHTGTILNKKGLLCTDVCYANNIWYVFNEMDTTIVLFNVSNNKLLLKLSVFKGNPGAIINKMWCDNCNDV